MLKPQMLKYANLIKRISQERTAERAEKCGYDLFMGLSQGDAEKRYEAWIDYLNTDTQRDGVWVPAIPL
jgi:hypothetical protein